MIYTTNRTTITKTATAAPAVRMCRILYHCTTDQRTPLEGARYRFVSFGVYTKLVVILTDLNATYIGTAYAAGRGQVEFG